MPIQLGLRSERRSRGRARSTCLPPVRPSNSSAILIAPLHTRSGKGRVGGAGKKCKGILTKSETDSSKGTPYPPAVVVRTLVTLRREFPGVRTPFWSSPSRVWIRLRPETGPLLSRRTDSTGVLRGENPGEKGPNGSPLRGWSGALGLVRGTGSVESSVRGKRSSGRLGGLAESGDRVRDHRGEDRDYCQQYSVRIPMNTKGGGTGVGLNIRDVLSQSENTQTLGHGSCLGRCVVPDEVSGDD